MPRKMPLIGPDALDPQDRANTRKSSESARGDATALSPIERDPSTVPRERAASHQVATNGIRHSTPVITGQLRATINPRSELASAINDWAAQLDPALLHLVKPASAISAFLKEHDGALAEMFRKTNGPHDESSSG